ncbi:MAG: hypothetical protein AB7L66_12280, partial [Gemmatimonadales bacterium]
MTIARRIALALFAIAPALAAQTRPAKKALTQADWDTWRSISGAALSNDGKWAVYTLVPQVGDGEMVIRATGGSTEYRVPRGFLGRPNNTPGGLRPAGGAGGGPGGGGAPPAQITADSRFVLATVLPTQAETEAARAASRASRGGGTRAPQPRNALAIVNLADGQVTTIANVRSFRLPEESGAWVAYVTADSAGADSTAGRPGGANGGRPAQRDRRSYGSPLVLRNLATGAEERLTDVLTFAFDDHAKVLVYTVASRDSTRDGAFVRTLATGNTATLLAGRGNYKGISVDSLGTQVAFYSDRDEFGRDKARFTIYHASLKGGSAQAVVAPAALPAGYRVADNAGLDFTAAGTALTLAIAPPMPDSVPADSLTDKAVLDLWHYKDPALQPSQRLSASRDRNRSFSAIYYLGTRKLVQLANDSIPTVSLSDDARIGLAASRERYQIEQMWGDGGTDVYAIDPATGAARLLAEKVSGQAQLSPDGKYLAWYDRGHWYAHTVATGKTVDLTGSLRGVNFEQETWDTPSIPA